MRKTEMADVDLDAGGLKQTFKDLFAGAAGGVAQVLLGKFSSVYVCRVICSSSHMDFRVGSIIRLGLLHNIKKV